ncbi:hypothetical protein [Cohnella sp. 56]|uniref:hypothetical protein n=1 Tax=Cohnella sp. 56 TaxID=3113722 RepID=UPI0030EAE530
MNKKIKKDLIVLFILLCLSALLFFLIDLFTLKNDHDGVSGNGNLGLLFVFPAIPLYVIMLAYAFRISQLHFRTRKNLKSYIWTLFLLLFLFIYGAYKQIQSLLQDLGGEPNEPQSIIYGWPWLNQYTNTLFFNFFTFTAGIMLILLVSSIVVHFRIRKKIKSQQT